ncbi:penicillin-binding protein [Streptomyces scopuliridis]|uniref:transglycosylase domain-containing protein n=1 Tax=Streptomyces scopuliridis TaxID=452529 RepID=UPI002DD97296|nr:transglycosylase domain-containing protein [Streptomyces scopuliridis]WSB33519.1 penicillin-binding protein [Streptomyces scopuliridis]
MRLPRIRRANRTDQSDSTDQSDHTENPSVGADAPPGPHRSRRIDFPRAGRHGPRRWLPSWKLVSGLFLLSVGALTGLFVAIYLNVEIPDEHDSARRQATVYYWADGSRMVSVGDVNRQDITLAQMPKSLRSAVIAAENADFYSDAGVSVTGIARAAVNIVKGKETQGGSTITQQYVKNTYLSQDQTVSRKVKELFLSLKVSNQKPKSEILQGYLNTSWFGRDSYGVQAASYAYYGVPAKDLNPSQGALLATLLKGADSYDPALSPANRERAEERWSWILDRQVETGSMSAEERAKYTSFPEPKPPVKPTSQAGQTGYLIDITNKYIKSRTGITDKDLAGGGYRVHTTFEKDKVRALTKAVEKVRAERLDPEKRAVDRHVQVGAASVRPEDGAIVAVYGGSDAIEHFSNNADTSGVPAGSAFKPFVYAAALEYGSARKQEAARAAGRDARRPVPTMTAEPMSLVDLTGPLVDSDNTPFVQTGKKIGLETVKKLAVASGLREESMAKLEPTFSIGTSTPSAVRLASAYTTFLNGGRATEPYSVTRIERDGVAVDGFEKPEARRAMEPHVAATVGAALQQVGWSALGPPKDRKIYYPVLAGKTGPNDRMKSAWFIGATEELSTSVTMFRTKPDVPNLLPMQGVGGPDSERGSAFPPLIWAEYQRTAVPPTSLAEAVPQGLGTVS